MVISLLGLILIVSITLYQGRNGTFSAFLMLIMTVCCSALAICTYEWVSANWVAPIWKAEYAAALSLALIFAVPLAILRVATDQLIKRMCPIPTWIDRITSNAFALMTGLVQVGTLMVALQLIPWHNGSILGYARVEITTQKKDPDGPNPEPPDPKGEESELWLSPDRFAVGLASFMSSGVMSGSQSFAENHPDLIQSIGWVNAAPAVAKPYAPPKSIEVVNSESVPVVYRMEPEMRNTPTKYEPIDPKSGHEFQMVRVRLKKAAKLGGKAHAFTLRQFRLVGKIKGSKTLEQHFPIAIQQQADETPNRHVRAVRNLGYGDWPADTIAYEPRPGNNGEVEVVFELPRDFQADYIEYKRAARAKVSFDDDGGGGSSDDAEDQAPISRQASSSNTESSSSASSSDTSSDSGSSSNRRASNRRRRGGGGGNVRSVGARAAGSRFGDALPQGFKAYTARSNTDISNGTISTGGFSAYLDEQSNGSKQEVTKFDVPSDKRLLQLNTDKLVARSGIGRLLSGAVQTVQNFYVEDEDGNRYKVAGKYAEADVNGRRIFEVQYFSGETGSIGGLGKFSKIKDRDLKGDYILYYLFLVDPGAEIVTFSTGGAATRADDLSDQNLVAPR
ncbi:MAG: hypothetical protein ACPGXK_11440 [Phycisphaerae bacterium]